MKRINTVAKDVVDSAFQVHTKLGPGLFETVYEVALEHEISKRGMIPPKYRINPKPTIKAAFVAIALTQYCALFVSPSGRRFCKKNKYPGITPNKVIGWR